VAGDPKLSPAHQVIHLIDEARTEVYMLLRNQELDRVREREEAATVKAELERVKQENIELKEQLAKMVTTNADGS
jgi:hypothetical protein